MIILNHRKKNGKRPFDFRIGSMWMSVFGKIKKLTGDKNEHVLIMFMSLFFLLEYSIFGYESKTGTVDVADVFNGKINYFLCLRSRDKDPSIIAANNAPSTCCTHTTLVWPLYVYLYVLWCNFRTLKLAVVVECLTLY